MTEQQDSPKNEGELLPVKLKRWLEKRGLFMSLRNAVDGTSGFERNFTVGIGRRFWGIDFMIAPFKGELENDQ